MHHSEWFLLTGVSYKRPFREMHDLILPSTFPFDLSEIRISRHSTMTGKWKFNVDFFQRTMTEQFYANTQKYFCFCFGEKQ